MRLFRTGTVLTPWMTVPSGSSKLCHQPRFARSWSHRRTCSKRVNSLFTAMVLEYPRDSDPGSRPLPCPKFMGKLADQKPSSKYPTSAPAPAPRPPPAPAPAPAPAWMSAFGGLRSLHKETQKINRVLQEKFERVEEDEWR